MRNLNSDVRSRKLYSKLKLSQTADLRLLAFFSLSKETEIESLQEVRPGCPALQVRERS